MLLLYRLGFLTLLTLVNSRNVLAMRYMVDFFVVMNLGRMVSSLAILRDFSQLLARLLTALFLFAMTVLLALLALVKRAALLALLTFRRRICVVKALRWSEGINTAVCVLLLLANDWLEMEFGTTIHTCMFTCPLL